MSYKYAYSRGDYTRGYRRGDPGFLSGLKKIGKVVGKVVSKVAPILPGPFGLIGKLAGPLIGGATAAAAGAAVTGLMTPGFSGPAMPAMLSPSTGPFKDTRGGSSSTATTYDGERRRSRRMNVGNVRALRRSMRRVSGFEKLARSTLQLTKTVRLKARRKR